MMLAAPPRATTGALEPMIAVAIAATVRKQFRDLFMQGSLLRVTGSSVRRKKVYGSHAVPPSGAQHLPEAVYVAEPQPLHRSSAANP